MLTPLPPLSLLSPIFRELRFRLFVSFQCGEHVLAAVVRGNCSGANRHTNNERHPSHPLPTPLNNTTTLTHTKKQHRRHPARDAGHAARAAGRVGVDEKVGRRVDDNGDGLLPCVVLCFVVWLLLCVRRGGFLFCLAPRFANFTHTPKTPTIIKQTVSVAVVGYAALGDAVGGDVIKSFVGVAPPWVVSLASAMVRRAVLLRVLRARDGGSPFFSVVMLLPTLFTPCTTTPHQTPLTHNHPTHTHKKTQTQTTNHKNTNANNKTKHNHTQNKNNKTNKVVVHMIPAYQVFSQPLFSAMEDLMLIVYPKAASLPERPLRLVYRSIYVVITTFIAIALPFFSSVRFFVVGFLLLMRSGSDGDVATGQFCICVPCVLPVLVQARDPRTRAPTTKTKKTPSQFIGLVGAITFWPTTGGRARERNRRKSVCLFVSSCVPTPTHTPTPLPPSS